MFCCRHKHSFNLNEAVKSTADADAKSDAVVNSNASAAAAAAVNDQQPVMASDSDSAASLPLTLSYMVLFWDELSKWTMKKIADNDISPVPQSVLTTSSDPVPGKLKKKEDRSGGKVSAKKCKGGKLVAAAASLRGNLFGAAADEPAVKVAASGGVDRDGEVLCELCGEEFAHPVTYHMRKAHPGCGRPAGGQGYNSGGNFCGGWAGSCGDGGVGGSTWYLMCDSCRARYLREKKRSGSGGGARKPMGARKNSAAENVVKALLRTELAAQWVLYSNAMFLLELAATSTCGLIHNSDSEGTLTLTGATATGGLSAVSEHPHHSAAAAGAGVTFPPVPFLYLQLHNTSSDDAVFAELIHSDRPPHSSVSVGGGAGLDRSVSDSYRYSTSRHRPLSSAYQHDLDEPVRASSSVFQRSISEMAGISRGEVTVQGSGSAAVVVGRHGQASVTQHSVSSGGGGGGGGGGVDGSGGVDESGLSLVKRPSVDMLRLIQSLESVDDVSDHVGQLSVMRFVSEHHELDVLRRVMSQSVRRAVCRTHALRALNWMMRSVSQTSCLHDLMWQLVNALSSTSASSLTTDDDDSDDVDSSDVLDDVAVCSHPLVDVGLAAGDATTRPLISAFHCLLQSIADVLMHLPAGSAVQRMAVRCWSVQFHANDHTFLHRSQVFTHISSILSSADDAALRDVTDVCSAVVIRQLTDVTLQADLKTSSRQAMVSGLTDGSTETFWESADDEKHKGKWISLSCGADWRLRVVCVHVDNARDIANKVSSVQISAGLTADGVEPVKHVELDQRHVGWVSGWLKRDSVARFVRVELRGPDNTLRVRQLKLLADCDEDVVAHTASSTRIQQRDCDNETLSVFRLLTSLVFGRLVVCDAGTDTSNSTGAAALVQGSESVSSGDDVDLKEHMVGILFSHSSELTKLQRQVCAHIVNSIRVETARVRSSWQQQTLMTGVDDTGDAAVTVSASDSYCFELLSLLLALSGSSVGRRYVSQQNSLIEDLVCLLHTASPRVQRQIVALLRRTLTDIAPRSLASLLGIAPLPASDLATLMSSDCSTSGSYQPGLLDVFLACIAKALSVQVKCRLPGVMSKSTCVTLASSNVSADSAELWWLRGSVSAQLAESIIRLLSDLCGGGLGSEWAAVSNCAVAGPIISLSRLPAASRTSELCLQSPVLWLALAALCVLTPEHCDRLSTTGRPSATSVQLSPSSSSPTCENHDDSETAATIQCLSGCGSLCTECDRVLHLSRRQRSHQRQVTTTHTCHQ